VRAAGGIEPLKLSAGYRSVKIEVAKNPYSNARRSPLQ
jgi:hypothetical protein